MDRIILIIPQATADAFRKLKEAIDQMNKSGISGARAGESMRRIGAYANDLRKLKEKKKPIPIHPFSKFIGKPKFK